jgi:hypothetical protein
MAQTYRGCFQTNKPRALIFGEPWRGAAFLKPIRFSKTTSFVGQIGF